MPTITQLEYILAVAKLKHFGKASKYCNVSQPSLSMQIQKVEDQLELMIFDRNKKPIEITTKGQAVIEQAQRMMAEYQKLLQVSRQETDQIKGDYRLGVIPTLSASVIPFFVEHFSKQYPRVSLFINELTTENIVTSLKTGEINSGILATPLPETHLDQKLLFYESFSVYCSKKHPLLNKKKLSLKDLEKHKDLWLLSDGHCFKNQVLNFCGIDTSLEVFNNIHFQSGSLETLKRLVEQAGGYTFLPQLQIEKLSADEKKQVRPFVRPLPCREVSLVFQKSHPQFDITDALAKVIDETLPPHLNQKKSSHMEVLALD